MATGRLTSTESGRASGRVTLQRLPEAHSPAHDRPAVVRLVVDDALWGTLTPADLIAAGLPRGAVVVGPAGMVRRPTARDVKSLDDAEAFVAGILEELTRRTCGNDLVFGIDGAFRRRPTLQAVVHVRPGGRGAADCRVLFKLHPAGKAEDAHLIGWRLARDGSAIPPRLAGPRRLRTSAGVVLPLVCHEAVLFSGRSRVLLRNGTKLLIRDYLAEQATAAPRPDYVAVATHWQTGGTASSAFAVAGTTLARETGATVVTSAFAPAAHLEAVARRFPVIGSQTGRVATLLVRQT